MFKICIILISFILALTSQTANAKSVEQCLLIQNLTTQKNVFERGQHCDKRFSPASTFKLPLAVIGFEEKILTDKDNPAKPYKLSYSAWLKSWKKTTTPTTWLRDSVVWYSRLITKELGAEKFQHYADLFNYGNKDLSGNKGKNNGLTHAWLTSSLKISPREQIAFIAKLLSQKLPLSATTYNNIIQTMPGFETPQNTQIWGKTGTAIIKNPDGTRTGGQYGWFIGWAEVKDQKYIFAKLVSETPPRKGFAGGKTREDLLKEFDALIPPNK